MSTALDAVDDPKRGRAAHVWKYPIKRENNDRKKLPLLDMAINPRSLAVDARARYCPFR